MLVMRGLAPDHATERDKPVEPLGRFRGQRNRRRDLEGARHRNRFAGRPGLGYRALGPLSQHRGEMRVIGRLDEQ